ncbi:MAG TPA: ribonuclease D [Thermoanaerobaculia bacterium]|nr:ribonuclease D [Thermoanaerobaculia bacterium]
MKWIESQPPFEDAMARMASNAQVAVDTEADSLHSYFDKVCLIQMSAGGEDLVIDPLSGIGLDSFGKLLGDPTITKVLHGGDYDLRILNRDFGFVVSNLIDTSICAQLLGYEAFGLAALLERHFGVKLNKTHQRADWAMRPLPPDMLEYAALDTHYLIELAAKLREELEALGRWGWALEEFARLEMVRYEKNDDPEPWRRMKNISGFDRRSLAILRDLHSWRDGLARKGDRPPFKVMGNEQILELSKNRPVTVADLAKIKGMSKYVLDRYGRDLVNIIRSAMAIGESDLPEKNEPKPWLRDREVEARIDRLKKVRDKVAAELKIDRAVLAPRHILAAVATTGSYDVPAMREWQKQVLGAPLLAALKK